MRVSSRSGLADALAKAGIERAGETKIKYLSTGYPVLDHRISGHYVGGGMPQGRMVEIFGAASCGKTAIATKLMASAQLAGGWASFKDHERSYEEGQAVALGLSLDPDAYHYDRPLTFEQSLDQATEQAHIVRRHLGKDAPMVMVFDSLAMMVPKSKWEKGAADYNMNDTTALARATSAAFPAFAQRCEEENILAVFLNQTRTKPGVMYGDPTTTPGGQTMEFVASVRLKLGRSYIMSADKKQKLGQAIGCETVKNKVHKPFQKCEWDFLFMPDGSGKMDRIGGCIQELAALGRIEQAGAYYVWQGKKYHRGPLVQLIEDTGAWDELVSLFPVTP
jgi:protein RecA